MASDCEIVIEGRRSESGKIQFTIHNSQFFPVTIPERKKAPMAKTTTGAFYIPKPKP
jgi:hypothetical protein